MNDLPELLFVNWDEFHQMGFELSRKLKKLRPESCTIISVARGGHALARLLSDFLKLPIFSVSIQSYQDLQQHELHITQELNVDLRNKNILLVDEIIDSGKTLVRALEYLEDFDTRSVTSVSLHVKPEAIMKSDFYCEETTKWVVYPYEVRETIEALQPIWRKSGAGDAALRKALLDGGIPALWVDEFMQA
ncbi:MAG: phosphoribosyltransferase [Kiritimatiellia bacterium]